MTTTLWFRFSEKEELVVSLQVRFCRQRYC